MKTYRRSSVQGYLNCAHRFRKEESGEIEQVMGEPALVGIWTHKVIADYLRRLQASGKPKDWSVVPGLMEQVPAKYYEQALWFMDDFRKREFDPSAFRLIDPGEPIIVKVNPRFNIQYQPDLEVANAFDDETLTDWKTGYATWTDKEQKKRLQAQWYTFAKWKLTGGQDVVTMQTEFLRMGLRQARSSHDAHDHRKFYDFLCHTISEIEAGVYNDATYNEGCCNCPLLAECPRSNDSVWTTVDGQLVLPNDPDIDFIATSLPILLDGIAQAKAALKPHAKLGPLKAGAGKAWQFTPPTSTRLINPKKTIAELDALEAEDKDGAVDWHMAFDRGKQKLLGTLKKLRKADAVTAGNAEAIIKAGSEPCGSAKFELKKEVV